ncbi:tRNA uracil 4-sulfurtransferase ThiI [Allofustis seminis]|uniref:tRNA uracil 4-sulfurtransferase ThiI n=1 Tax=Allofustis seminis TaxID=166939 RepID=UPI000382CA0C|nr:tRNA uracil 4-sulfurtransferase ThiI [Allofustis seminis]
MKPSQIMVRYGELSTKGKNINDFIQLLAQNIKYALKDYPKAKVQWHRDRTYIVLHGESEEGVIAQLKNVFGIQTMSPVIQVEKTLEAVEQAAISLAEKLQAPGKSFKINTRRADHDFAYDTIELNRRIGSAVAQAYPELVVKMNEPDFVIFVEVRDNGIYLYAEIIQGPGGMPVGSAGRGMLMLSGGIDSPVAGYLSMKRGIEIEAVHFASPPYTSPQALQKAKDLAAKLTKYGREIKFIEVPFTETQEEIKRVIPEGYIMTVTRRMMLRITESLMHQRKALAIMNGESLGQVASQTLESMRAINAVTCVPILRPLVAMDKTEIVKIAEEIDTFELSIQPFEDCCTIFTPPRPKTKPHLDDVEKFEAAMDIDGLVKRAVAGVKIDNIGLEDVAKEIDAFEDLL